MLQTDADARVCVWNPLPLSWAKPLIPRGRGRVPHLLYLSSKWHFLVVWPLHLLCPLLWPPEGTTLQFGVTWLSSSASPQPPTAWGHPCGQYISIKLLETKTLGSGGWAQPAGDLRGPTPQPSDGVTRRVSTNAQVLKSALPWRRRSSQPFTSGLLLYKLLNALSLSFSSVKWDDNNSSYPTLLLLQSKRGCSVPGT